MILAETSVWVDHLRNGNERLKTWLLEGLIVHHTFISEELAAGYLKNRAEILRLLESLPHVPGIPHNEYHYFIEEHRLFGRGLGMVDVHLLAAARASGARLATYDKALGRAARDLGIFIS